MQATTTAVQPRDVRLDQIDTVLCFPSHPEIDPHGFLLDSGENIQEKRTTSCLSHRLRRMLHRDRDREKGVPSIHLP